MLGSGTRHRTKRRDGAAHRRHAGRGGGARTWLPLLLLLTLAGCTSVRLVSDYDEQTDAAVTAFQRKMDTFLQGLERSAGKPEAAYAASVGFYDGARVDLRVLQARAGAIPRNDITTQQLALLMDSLGQLEKLHGSYADAGIPAEQIAPLRDAFTASCQAILKFELAKKSGRSR